MSKQVALARAAVTEAILQRWKRQDPEFLVRWNEMVRNRDHRGCRLVAPRRASPAVVRRVLAAADQDPETGLTAHCRAAGTTVAKLEAACAADPALADLYTRAREALVVPLEQAQIHAMKTDPKAFAARERFLGRSGATELWG